MKEEITRIKRWLSQMTKVRQFMVGILLVVVVFVVFNAIPMNTKGRIESADAAVAALYSDENQQFIRSDVSQRQLKQAMRKSQRLVGDERKRVAATVVLAEEKYQAVQRLQKIYQPLENDVVNKEQVVELPFLADVTREVIEGNIQLPAWSVQDEGTQLLDDLMLSAKSDLSALMSMQAGLDFIMPQYQMTRDAIPEIIQTIKHFSQQSDTVQQHPQTAELDQQLSDFLTGFVPALESSHQNNPYPEELLRELFASERASSLMAGTVLDVRPKVSLTFDDGPNEEFTPQVLDILKEYGIKGTFFVVGRYVDLYPEMAQRIVDEGHTIANHSYDHPDFSTISDQEVRQQIDLTQVSIEAATGVTASLYRMPYGSGGERVFRLIPELTSVTWNTDTGDWYLRDAEAIYQNIMSQLSDDMLILLHDTNQDSVDVLKKLVVAFEENHYQFVDPLSLEFDFRY